FSCSPGLRCRAEGTRPPCTGESNGLNTSTGFAEFLVYNQPTGVHLKTMPLYPFPALFIVGDIVDLVRETELVAQAVLVVLLVFSLVSWSIILSKWSIIKRARVQSGRFLRAFRRAQRLKDMGAVSVQFRPSPLERVFQSGYREFERQLGTSGSLRNPLAVQRAMQIASSEEMTRFERNVPW